MSFVGWSSNDLLELERKVKGETTDNQTNIVTSKVTQTSETTTVLINQKRLILVQVILRKRGLLLDLQKRPQFIKFGKCLLYFSFSRQI